MPLAEWSLRLQDGITGGFAPPTPSAIHTLNKSSTQTHVLVASSIRPDGAPTLSDAAPKSLSITGADEADVQCNALVDELYDILKQIPTEEPVGSEDIYGMDKSIAFGTENFTWCNGGPSGCGGGVSMVQATDDDKAKFKRAVEIVDTLVQKAV